MGTHELPQIPKEEVDADIISKLLFLSYRYSQGYTGLQTKIYIYLSDLHPEWEITPEAGNKIQEKLTQRIKRFLPSESSLVITHKVIKEGALASSISDELSVFESKVRQKKSRKESDSIKNLEELADNLLVRDTDQLEDGRLRSAPSKSQTSPIFNPRLSHLIYYGFQGNDAGAPEYNQMFKDVSEGLQNTRNKTMRNNLDRLLALHQKYNP